MTTIDLSTPPAPPSGLLDALPRRVALTLPELRFVADHAGGAPLPFDVTAPAGGALLDDRLGQSRGSAEDAAYLSALASLHDAETSLTRRGLRTDDGLDAGLVGAVGLLATPTLALDLDVVVGSVQARAWHRQSVGAVATLATVDGLVFELAWFATDQWSAELARVAVVPEDVQLRESAVPGVVELPYELADAAGEALRSSRPDLIPVLAAQHSGEVTDASGATCTETEVGALLAGLGTEAQGRLRGLVADVSGEQTSVVGVVSWTLLADGWHALRPHRRDGTRRVEVRRVGPADLARELAPVLAEVSR